MARNDDLDFAALFADQPQQEDSLETLFGDVGNGAAKMAAGIRPMADAAQQEAYRRADALAAAARSGGIRPYDDSMGAARRYAEHFARGQRDADAFGRTHVGSAALQAKIDADRRAQDLEWAKANLDAGIRRREIDTGLASESEKAAGTLAQENARGMWGVTDAAAGIAQEKLKTRGGIREAETKAKSDLIGKQMDLVAGTLSPAKDAVGGTTGAEGGGQQEPQQRRIVARKEGGATVYRDATTGELFSFDWTKVPLISSQEFDNLGVRIDDDDLEAIGKDLNDARGKWDIYWAPDAQNDELGGYWRVAIAKKARKNPESFRHGTEYDAPTYYMIRKYLASLAK